MRFDWKAVLGIIITVLLLWWALHGVPFGEVWANVRQGNMLLLGAAVFVATFGFLIRALRWKVLLTPLAPDTTLHSRFAAVSVGFMANNVLPARVGEFARAYALSRVEPVSVSGAFGTLVVERVLDGLTLLGLLLVTVSWPTFPAADVLREGPIGGALKGIVAILALLLVLMGLLLVRPRPFIRVVERIVTRLPGDFARPVVSALEAFLDSLGIFRSPVLLTKAILWTVGFWLWHGFSFYLGMLAFGIEPEGAVVAALFTEAVVGFGVAIPSAPGFIGTFHASAGWALSTVYGVDPARSLAFAFGYHFGGWLPITVIGLWYVWRLGLSMKDVERSEERVEEAVEAAHPVAAELLARRGDAGPAAVQRPEPRGSSVRIDAPAKVNLLLRVLARDADTGYHQLETLFQAVDLRDTLLVEVAGKGMEVTVEGMDVGPPRENLVWQAAAAFAAETALVTGLRIHLVKRIPAGAGLGGGSSDAAATLRGLNALFGHPVDETRLAELAGRLGSDVPFFLGSGTLAVARGRGERLRSLSPLPERWLVVAVPPVHVATAEAYVALARHRERVGSEAGTANLRGEEVRRWDDVVERAVNDFEETVLRDHPAAAELKGRLADEDPDLVLLSGSGSAVFAVFDTEKRARAVAGRLREQRAEASVFVARTLSSWPLPELEA